MRRTPLKSFREMMYHENLGTLGNHTGNWPKTV
jgi:hypothetical protein